MTKEKLQAIRLSIAFDTSGEVAQLAEATRSLAGRGEASAAAGREACSMMGKTPNPTLKFR
jgi:hypothetical protein